MENLFKPYESEFQKFNEEKIRLYQNMLGDTFIEQTVELRGQRILKVVYAGNSINGDLYRLFPLGNYGLLETENGFLLAENAIKTKKSWWQKFKTKLSKVKELWNSKTLTKWRH